MSIWPNGCFEGRHVLVTGGTSGIGAAVARAFLGEGALVTATGISRAEVDSAMAEMDGLRAEVLDVRDGAAVARLVGGLPALHHVVNCAGAIRRGAEHEPDVFADIVDINLTGTMRIGGLVPGYAASKGGIAQLTKSLAIAYAADGIRVNAVAPGWIETPLTAALREDQARSSAILARTPLGRWGRPDDIAGGVLFLSSPLSGFVTGSVLAIDGGYLVT